jgi:para-nitrobenzyl esterase
MQDSVSMPGETPPVVNEDCLYLNLWTPAKNALERLPVIVWIYGGGFISGSASMPLYWGDRLAHKGIIVVTIAYRLGPLGFLAILISRASPRTTRPGTTVSWTRSPHSNGFRKTLQPLAATRKT